MCALRRRISPRYSARKHFSFWPATGVPTVRAGARGGLPPDWPVLASFASFPPICTRPCAACSVLAKMSASVLTACAVYVMAVRIQRNTREFKLLRRIRERAFASTSAHLHPPTPRERKKQPPKGPSAGPSRAGSQAKKSRPLSGSFQRLPDVPESFSYQ